MSAFASLMQRHPLIFFHLVTALAALLLGGLILWGRKGSWNHRTLGWMWVTLMACTTLSSAFIRDYKLPNLYGYTPVHGFTLYVAVMLPLAVLYTIAMIGSIGGGWFPMYFIKKGYKVYDGRMKAMLVIAFFPLVILLAQPLGYISYWIPVLLIGIGASAHAAWSANIFTTVSDMFPKKAVASVVGIGGMAGGIGGVVMSKLGGWLFDSYKYAGIAKSWMEAKAIGLADYVNNIQSLKLLNKKGELIDLNHIELRSLPKEVVEQLQSIDANMFDKLLQLQKPLVAAEMNTSYTIMFAICAVAYLIAWSVMKSLVPKYKVIQDL